MSNEFVISVLKKKGFRITKQRKLIIKYGYYLRVPVNYLATYVPCSEYTCRKVLKKYREKLEFKSTSLNAI